MRPTPAQIDALLPQTQCGLCGYGGCLPYATALAEGEATINLCPPGGVDTLQALGDCLGLPSSLYVADMQAKAIPPRVAVIREAECIGCTKCIQACPVDAIVGSAKLMHTIITDACTGCELCIPPCPVDCISLLETPAPSPEKINERRDRLHTRNARIAKNSPKNNQTTPLDDKKQQLMAALARAKAKKSAP
jgi:electron transport complex protein RnfB